MAKDLRTQPSVVIEISGGLLRHGPLLRQRSLCATWRLLTGQRPPAAHGPRRGTVPTQSWTRTERASPTRRRVWSPREPLRAGLDERAGRPHVHSAARAERPPPKHARPRQGGGSHTSSTVNRRSLAITPCFAQRPSAAHGPQRGTLPIQSWTRTERVSPTSARARPLVNHSDQDKRPRAGAS